MTERASTPPAVHVVGRTVVILVVDAAVLLLLLSWLLSGFRVDSFGVALLLAV